jgi:hypothetical protein
MNVIRVLKGETCFSPTILHAPRESDRDSRATASSGRGAHVLLRRVAGPRRSYVVHARQAARHGVTSRGPGTSAREITAVPPAQSRCRQRARAAPCPCPCARARRNVTCVVWPLPRHRVGPAWSFVFVFLCTNISIFYFYHSSYFLKIHIVFIISWLVLLLDIF